ncbi:MAG: hypothetical protein DPW18_05150 [Chloroflexi bacterium]|nr:hypothetical protein [Chloroflexota bacterium]MDL1910038.1 hypothetical protein [Chloroflexi bacterium CFX6]
MDLKFDAQAKVSPGQTETYMAFRSAIPKPSNEEAHLRHILRFYMTRAMQKRGEQEIYVLPHLNIEGKTIRVDVAAGSAGKYTLSICEPESVTPQTEEILDLLKDVEGVDVVVVHSQYGKPGNVMDKFKDQLASKKFHLLAVVPPPFDDVYEYDIWMFETTFRNLFEGN